MNPAASFLSGVCILALTATASAQQTPSTVTGQGTALIEKQPQIMRLHLNIAAQGKTLKEALAKLKERRDKAAAQFTTWGALKEGMDPGTPKVLPAKDDRQRRMEMMVRSRLAKTPAAAKPEQIVKVSCTIKADWKLEGLDIEAILLKASELREQIETADLAGVKADQAASPEQQEEAEENQAPAYYDGSEQQPAGEPVVLYVSRITPAESAKALADAFADAQKQSQELAAAAKVQLGALNSLSQMSSPDYGQQVDMDGAYASMMYRYMQQAQMGQRGGEGEAMGASPAKVAHRVMVTASFSIKP